MSREKGNPSDLVTSSQAIMATRPRIVNILLPKSLDNPKDWSTLVSKLKDFRLLSLRTAPEAFGSTYAVVSATFTTETWEERLRNPLVSTFAAVAVDGEETRDDISTLVEGEWVCTAALRGPTEEPWVDASKSPWEAVGTKVGGIEDAASRPAIHHYQVNGVFTVPAYRCLGIASRLIDQAVRLGEAKSKDEGIDTARFTLLAYKDNIAATKTYQKCGFSIIAEETILSPRKEKVDGTWIPEQDIQVYTMERWAKLSG